MDPRDILVHRVVATLIVGDIVAIGLLQGPVMALGAALSSGLPIAILSAADHRFYGPKKDPNES